MNQTQVVKDHGKCNKNIVPKKMVQLKSTLLVGRSSHTCELCGFEPKTKNKYREKQDHLVMKHFREKIDLVFPQRRPYSCPTDQCGFTGKDRQALLRHYAGKHGKLEKYLKEALAEKGITYVASGHATKRRATLAKGSVKSFINPIDLLPKVPLPRNPVLSPGSEPAPLDLDLLSSVPELDLITSEDLDYLATSPKSDLNLSPFTPDSPFNPVGMCTPLRSVSPMTSSTSEDFFSPWDISSDLTILLSDSSLVSDTQIMWGTGPAVVVETSDTVPISFLETVDGNYAAVLESNHSDVLCPNIVNTDNNNAF